MALIGTFGDIMFEVDMLNARIIKDYSRKISMRLAKHEIIGQKPLIEVLGEDLDEISFTMHLNSKLGIDPTKEFSKLQKICIGGQANYLILGMKLVSENPFIIESLSQEIKVVNSIGETVISDINISLKEYPVQSVLNTSGGSNNDGGVKLPWSLS